MSRSSQHRTVNGTWWRGNMLSLNDVPVDVALGAKRDIAARTCGSTHHHFPFGARPDGERDMMARNRKCRRRHFPFGARPDGERDTVAQNYLWRRRHVPLGTGAVGQRDTVAAYVERACHLVPLARWLCVSVHRDRARGIADDSATGSRSTRSRTANGT